MQYSLSLTGQTTLTLNGRVFNDFADGDVAVLTFSNDSSNLAIGKGGNAIFAKNEQGRAAELSFRIIKGTGDDKWLNTSLLSMLNDFPRFVVLNGELLNPLGDGNGTLRNERFLLQNGVFKKQIEGKYNTSGETDQGVATYVIMFSRVDRLLD